MGVVNYYSSVETLIENMLLDIVMWRYHNYTKYAALYIKLIKEKFVKFRYKYYIFQLALHTFQLNMWRTYIKWLKAKLYKY